MYIYIYISKRLYSIIKRLIENKRYKRYKTEQAPSTGFKFRDTHRQNWLKILYRLYRSFFIFQKIKMTKK